MRLLLLFLVYAMILSVALARKDADANYLAIAPRAAERAETTSRRGRRGDESRREKCHAHPRRWDALRAASIDARSPGLKTRPTYVWCPTPRARVSRPSFPLSSRRMKPGTGAENRDCTPPRVYGGAGS